MTISSTGVLYCCRLNVLSTLLSGDSTSDARKKAWLQVTEAPSRCELRGRNICEASVLVSSFVPRLCLSATPSCMRYSCHESCLKLSSRTRLPRRSLSDPLQRKWTPPAPSVASIEAVATEGDGNSSASHGAHDDNGNFLKMLYLIARGLGDKVFLCVLMQVEGVSYRPQGIDTPLLSDVTMSLPHKSLGLVYGRSGSGKTTLLQVLAGLAAPSAGSICVGRGETGQQRPSLTRAELAEKVGIVFQFPERYFLADSVLEELTFGWPRRAEDIAVRIALAARLEAAVSAVGLEGVMLNANPRSLSGGNQRRLALAVQLVRMPELLVLDEPLAGLDWKARADVVKLLSRLKEERSIVVVSHDLRELSPLVDRAWHMHMGGRLTRESWPPKRLKLELM